MRQLLFFSNNKNKIIEIKKIFNKFNLELLSLNDLNINEEVEESGKSFEENAKIKSDYGKYNIDNNDTIFSKNVFINYRSDEINSDYVDFSLIRNSLIISKNVVYSNQKNLLKADVLEIDIETKNTKIFMYEEEKKVKIKSLKNHGNN